MTVSVFQFDSYKAFLLAWIDQQPHNGHGSKSILAKHTQCNPAYVTQVLNGNAQFSLEQVEKLKTVLNLDSEEFDFLVLLVERERSGTTTLTKYFTGKIDKILENRKQIKNRIKNDDVLTEEAKTRYYSNWIYMAVHMALTIPDFQTLTMVAHQLKISERAAKGAIDFLEKYGIIAQTKTGYKMGVNRCHLAHDSDLISKHHNNWRLQAMRSLDQLTDENLHYSSVVSISQKDFSKIRSELLSAIERAKGVVKESPEETLVSFCVDFFKISVD